MAEILVSDLCDRRPPPLTAFFVAASERGPCFARTSLRLHRGPVFHCFRAVLPLFSIVVALAGFSRRDKALHCIWRTEAPCKSPVFFFNGIWRAEGGQNRRAVPGCVSRHRGDSIWSRRPPPAEALGEGGLVQDEGGNPERAKPCLITLLPTAPPSCADRRCGRNPPR
jgi:hypothetical protein